MKTVLKYAVAATLAGALALAAASPSEARGGRVAAGIIGGLAAGAIIGSIANQGYYGGPGYYGSGYGPGYGYAPSYGYAPGYYANEGYAYEPAPVYVAPRRAYRGGGGGCWIATDTARGYGYYGPCN